LWEALRTSAPILRRRLRPLLVMGVVMNTAGNGLKRHSMGMNVAAITTLATED
jgi:hypothetical protein